jgi:uncharacterized protein YcbK (DUF882 family)
MRELTKNFTIEEMDCPCCGVCNMNDEFMKNLQEVREECGFGFKVNSAYRCKKENERVSKNTRGQHITGEAVDISCKDRYKRRQILESAIKNGYFKDIAIAKTFIHLGKGNVKHGIGVY